MNIKILPKKNSSITKEIEFKLGKYTIFAGENNAGKTNLMKAIREELPENQTIYIPAESVKAQDHLNTTKKEDPMREAFLKLVDVGLEELPTINYEVVEDLLNKISIAFDTYEVKKIKLELHVKKLTESDVKKIIKEEVSKKILNSVVKDSYGTGCDLAIEEVGQGTQRLIIVATLQELSKIKLEKGKGLFLIFEEPEIYLHPRLKRSLYEALTKISENGISVILTTHDPYFIELGADQTIYNVSRGDDGATRIDPPLLKSILDTPSHAEINYVIFDVPSTDYLLQLYQKASEDGVSEFKTHMIGGLSLYDIRANLTHKTNSTGRNIPRNLTISEDIKKKTIDYLRSVLTQITT